MLVVDSDDFLLGYNATTRFDAKGQIEAFFEEHKDCASLMATWFEVAPEGQDVKRGSGASPRTTT